jgi:hypothetical protein
VHEALLRGVFTCPSASSRTAGGQGDALDPRPGDRLDVLAGLWPNAARCAGFSIPSRLNSKNMRSGATIQCTADRPISAIWSTTGSFDTSRPYAR